MILKSMTLKNFRPYRGEVVVDFTAAEGNSLILIEGENMTGKTALFMALSWCLYGEAKSRTNVTIPPYLPGAEASEFLINRRALDEGDRLVEVRLSFEHDGKLWELTRNAKCAGDPADGYEFQLNTYLSIDGAPETANRISTRVNDVIHHDASQFYFFDGELLSQYEKWLDDPVQAKVRVKNAVERAVGISALRLREPLTSIEEYFSDEVRRAERKANRHLSTLEEINLLRQQELGLVGEIRSLKERIEGEEEERARIGKTHDDLAAWNAAKNEIYALESRIDAEKEKERNANNDIRSLIKTRYWMPLHAKAEQLISKTIAEIRQVLEVAPHLCMESAESGICSLCSQPINAAMQQQLLEKAADLNPQISSVQELEAAFARLEWTRRFVDPSGVSHLRTCEDTALGARLDVQELDKKAADLRAQHPVKGSLAREMERLGEIAATIGKLQGQIESAEKERGAKTEEIKKLESKIAKGGTSNPALGKRYRAASFATAAFERSLEQFTQSARTVIADRATAAFRDLVDVEGYDAIRISEEYRVSAVDRDGNAQPAPSAGGQQLLTLSLLAGLNGAAVHEAPIVMDTPFGRLDRQNRRRIVQWASKLVSEKQQQVVLMVHSGEVTRDDLAEWNVAPGRAYEIQNTDTIYEHTIVPRD